jgi:hypothetical protein
MTNVDIWMRDNEQGTGDRLYTVCTFYTNLNKFSFQFSVFPLTQGI